jgi:hypothetical protein
MAAMILACLQLPAQTFSDRHVINTHSVEMLKGGYFDFRVSHRFGDMFGDAGGWPTFYGLENAADILIGGEYGLSNNIDIGLNRTKGAGPLNKFVNGFAKFRVLNQFREDTAGLSIVLLGIMSVTTMQESPSPDALSNFRDFSHRLVYTGQAIFGRRFSDAFSLQALVSYTHRNQVLEGDDNDLFSVGGAFRLKLTEVMRIVGDVNFPISDLRTSENGYFPSIGFGIEFETGGGHVFQVNFTNARGIIENDYIPYTRSDWGEGEFRLGFTISRLFIFKR